MDTRIMNQRYENQKFKQGFTHVIGCDEVGRGCLAGPVVAAAVVFDSLKIKDSSFAEASADKKGLRIAEINDSKLLTSKKREELSQTIKQSCVAWGIGLVEHHVIDEINIHHASLRAMRLAVESILGPIPSESRFYRNESRNLLMTKKNKSLLSHSDALMLGRDGTLLALDGKFTIPSFPMEQEAIIDGDAKILSIAAASIIAKVYRDNLMQTFDKQYPRYKFGQHKGYATQDHRSAILQHGLTPIHRLSFCSNYI